MRIERRLLRTGRDSRENVLVQLRGKDARDPQVAKFAEHVSGRRCGPAGCALQTASVLNTVAMKRHLLCLH